MLKTTITGMLQDQPFIRLVKGWEGKGKPGQTEAIAGNCSAASEKGEVIFWCVYNTGLG